MRKLVTARNTVLGAVGDPPLSPTQWPLITP